MKRRKYASDEEALAGQKAKAKAYREKRHAAGLCIDCAAPCVNRRTCEKCCRRSLIRKHKNGIVKGPYRLGSKLSPERSIYWLRLIKNSNPLLAEHWTEIVSWLRKNFELYIDSIDRASWDYIPLRVDAVGFENEPASQSGIGQATLEDLVIAKIDLERELQRCPQAKIPAETDATSRALSGATAMIEKTTGRV